MNNYILNCESPLLSLFNAACCQAAVQETPSIRVGIKKTPRTNDSKCHWQYIAELELLFLLQRVKQILHLCRQVVLVCLLPRGFNALEQRKGANEGIKKKKKKRI